MNVSQPAATVSQLRAATSADLNQLPSFNFSRIMESVLIPKVIARERALAPGARLLWGILRQRTHNSGICTTPNKVLAAELGVTDRQLQRYLRQLEDFPLIRSRTRKGGYSARVMLLHPILSGHVPDGHIFSDPGGKQPENACGKTPPPSGDINVVTPRHKRRDPTTHVSPLKEEVLSWCSPGTNNTAREQGGKHTENGRRAPKPEATRGAKVAAIVAKLLYKTRDPERVLASLNQSDRALPEVKELLARCVETAAKHPATIPG